MMRLHDRLLIVQAAHLEAKTTLNEIIRKYDLTAGEIVALYAAFLAEEAKWMIREERHPDDPSHKGDEA